LTFVTVEEASIEDFLAVSAGSPYQERLRDYAEALLRQGTTRPDWCVVALAAYEPVARAALWAVADGPTPTDLVLVDTDWSDALLSDARALLGHVHDLAASLGATELWHHVDNPPVAPQYQEHDAPRVRLLEKAGYELQRDGLRWLYPTSKAHARVPETALGFRTLGEVGEDEFIQAMAATYEGTPDSMLTQHIQESGLLEGARSDFRDYQQMEYEPNWWELAFAGDGTVAGVIMPARNPSSAVVAYVGVVPAHRGRGLAAQLVERATAQLVAAGAGEIRGDCDRDNAAMAKAFERAGYEQFARRRSYRRIAQVTG
jgi:RimJ/RimL family protein N-acetyltransferase